MKKGMVEIRKCSPYQDFGERIVLESHGNANRQYYRVMDVEYNLGKPVGSQVRGFVSEERREEPEPE